MSGHPVPYQQVADIVRNWPRLTGHVKFIADTFEVPYPTAARWVHQARLRGFLPANVKTAPCSRCQGTGTITTRFGPKAAAGK